MGRYFGLGLKYGNGALQNHLLYAISSAELKTAPNQEYNDLGLFVIYFHTFLSGLKRQCSRSDVLLAVIRLVPVPSSEELS